MLCQDCNKREASIHLTQIVNNEKVVLNLCKHCAEKRGFHSPFEQVPFPLAEIVSGMVGPLKSQKIGKKTKAERENLKCSNCGMTFEEFGRIGRLGCPQCYTAFHPETGGSRSGMCACTARNPSAHCAGRRAHTD